MEKSDSLIEESRPITELMINFVPILKKPKTVTFPFLKGVYNLNIPL